VLRKKAIQKTVLTHRGIKTLIVLRFNSFLITSLSFAHCEKRREKKKSHLILSLLAEPQLPLLSATGVKEFRQIHNTAKVADF